MNLVLCNRNCKHEKNGYCGMNSPSSVTNSAGNGCLYYTNKDSCKAEKFSKSSILDKIEKTI